MTKQPTTVELVGTNPGVLLFADEVPTAMASLWTVDWSVWGSGTALLVIDAGGWRTIGTDEHLARILLDEFTRHFPEAESFGSAKGVTHVDAPLEVEVDLRSGLHATGGGWDLRIGDVKDRRPFNDPAFRLGEISRGLSNVYVPCGTAELSFDRSPVAGAPRCTQLADGRWSSTAYLAVAEVWTSAAERPRRQRVPSQARPKLKVLGSS